MVLFKRLRSAFQGIEGREWLLLTLETLGVLAGILIAFELNAWAAARDKAADQRRLLERLLDESEASVDVLRNDRSRLEGLVEREQAFATMIAHQGRCPPEPLWRAVSTVEMYPGVRVPTSVYQEVVGSGGLSAIQDAKVRQAVSEFHSQLAWVASQTDFFRAARVDPVGYDDPRVVVDYDRDSDEPEVVRYDRQSLCASLPFRNRMAAAVRNHAVTVGYREDLLSGAANMCAAIGEALHRPCAPQSGPLRPRKPRRPS